MRSDSDKSLGLEGIIFTTFLKCGMLREYYLSSKQYLVMLKCYLRFTGRFFEYCLNKCAHEFYLISFHFFDSIKKR